MTYFDPYRGFVTPCENCESDAYGSLKDVTAALKNVESKHTMPPDDLCDAVERVLYKYQLFVLQGVREDFASHRGVSWYLVDKGDGRALISYQDGSGADWANNCFADEVPLWLLMGLFRRIQRRKPLGDQEADETIKRVDDADAAYVATGRERDAERNLRLSGQFRHGDDDE
jgi:hypothetical protein